MSPAHLSQSTPAYSSIESRPEPIGHVGPPAAASPPFVTCGYCGSATSAEVKFCGMCGRRAKPEAVESVLAPVPVNYEIATPLQPTDVEMDSAAPTIERSEPQDARAVALPDKAINSGESSSSAGQKRPLIISGAAALVLALTAISSIGAYYYWFGSRALENKLADAIRKG